MASLEIIMRFDWVSVEPDGQVCRCCRMVGWGKVWQLAFLEGAKVEPIRGIYLCNACYDALL